MKQAIIILKEKIKEKLLHIGQLKEEGNQEYISDIKDEIDDYKSAIELIKLYS